MNSFFFIFTLPHPTDEAFFDSENDPEKCCLLLQFILNCLYKIFLFDTQHFLSKERAEALMMPLVDQVTESNTVRYVRLPLPLQPCRLRSG